MNKEERAYLAARKKSDRAFAVYAELEALFDADYVAAGEPEADEFFSFYADWKKLHPELAKKRSRADAAKEAAEDALRRAEKALIDKLIVWAERGKLTKEEKKIAYEGWFRDRPHSRRVACELALRLNLPSLPYPPVRNRR